METAAASATHKEQQRAGELRVAYVAPSRRMPRCDDSQSGSSSKDDDDTRLRPPPPPWPSKQARTSAAAPRGKAIVPPKVSLQVHKSSLPTILYLLSFCPKLPSPFTSPKAFVQHPGVLYFLGLLSATLSGLCVPALDLIFGKVWTKDIIRPDATPQIIRATSNRAAWYVALIAIAYLVFSWTFLVCFTSAAQVLSVNLRHAYVASSLCQDSAWHEEHGAGEIAAHAGKEISAIRVAFGEKLAFVLWSCSTLLASLIIGFTQGAKIAAVLWALVPFTLIIFAFLAVATDKVVGPLMKLEGTANSFIEEAFAGVRVTQAFAMRERIVAKFEDSMLAPILKLSVKRSALRAAESGLFYFALTVSYAFAFFIIAQLKGPTGSSLTIFWGVLNGLFALLNVVPMLTNVQDAVSALDHIRCVIERKPLIDIRDTGGAVPRVDATAFDSPSIKFKHVTMAYPSRPNVASLIDATLTVPSGKVTALVGSSGSGKSTLTELIVRAYDPLTANVPHPVDTEEARLAKVQAEKEERRNDKKKATKNDSADLELSTLTSPSRENINGGLEKDRELFGGSPVRGSGTVVYAGRDVREVNLVWLRSQIAVVRQSPQIFTGTIFENTAAGLVGTEWELRGTETITAKERKGMARIRQKVKVALKKAQAWDFVSRLPEGMDTCINGGKTGLLSGGQRQRIAIARALVGEPKLLIIDEGTSALDSSTEAAIRDMLAEEQKKRGMTVILIAHRLSTIQHADQIIVLSSGYIVNRGVTTSKSSAYAALMKSGGTENTFRKMVLSQQSLATGPVLAPTFEEEDAQSVKSDHSHEFSDDATTQVPSTSAVFESSQGWNVVPMTASDSTHPNVHGRPMSPSVSQFPNLRRHLTSRQSHRYGIPGRGAGVQSRASEYRDTELAEVKEDASVERGYIVKFYKLLCDYKWLVIVGLLGSLAVGASFPISAYLVGETVESLAETDNAERVRQTNRWALWFLVLAIADLALILATSTSLEVASERIIARLKVDGMRSLLQQEIGFFDSPESQPGTVAANLASFPQHVGSATGLVTTQILVSSGNLVGSFILALALSWKAALTIFSPVILLFLSAWANVVLLEKYEAMVSGPAGEAVGQLAEAMDAYHEVITLGREQEIMRQMDERSRAQPKRSSYLIWGAGGFAVSQAMILGVASLVFYYCGELYARSEIDTRDLYTVFECAVIAVFAASRLLTFSPDIGRAAAGFKFISRWIDREPKIATLIPANGLVPLEGQFFSGEGDIVFCNVEMRYPQRPDHAALKGLDLVIRSKQSHAFCGVSGGGKSSILQLCARFYDPHSGTIHVGGADVRKIPLEDFRASIAIVTQEATLLSGTIRWNIALGARSPETITQREIEQACEQACILDFIRGLPHGFDTDIGSKGSQLSGGQKQRICIARAIVRQPRILLLDEATSALDAQSEASVQRALDRASRGRTTITIAHRLSTIRNADVIHVVEDGQIIESGSHSTLLAAGGRYLELIQAQI